MIQQLLGALFRAARRIFRPKSKLARLFIGYEAANGALTIAKNIGSDRAAQEEAEELQRIEFPDKWKEDPRRIRTFGDQLIRNINTAKESMVNDFYLVRALFLPGPLLVAMVRLAAAEYAMNNFRRKHRIVGPVDEEFLEKNPDFLTQHLFEYQMLKSNLDQRHSAFDRLAQFLVPLPRLRGRAYLKDVVKQIEMKTNPEASASTAFDPNRPDNRQGENHTKGNSQHVPHNNSGTSPRSGTPNSGGSGGAGS